MHQSGNEKRMQHGLRQLLHSTPQEAWAMRDSREEAELADEWHGGALQRGSRRVTQR